MKELTKAEEQVMKYLWKLEKAFLKDIIDKYPEPKPAYTTVQTVIKVLTKKEFIGYKKFGKTNQYFPLISKEQYFRKHISGVVNNFFNGSIGNFTSFFTDDENLNINQLNEIKDLIETKINNLKKTNE